MSISANKQINDSDSDEDLLLNYLNEINDERIKNVEKAFSSYLEKSSNFQGNTQLKSNNESKEKNKAIIIKICLKV